MRQVAPTVESQQMESFAQHDPSQLTSEQVLRSRDQSLEQIVWARSYSLQLIHSVPEDLWYVRPAGLDTHLAWQVGHLAVSQYGLMLFRQRGRLPGDLKILPGWLRKQFGRGTTPSRGSEGMPSREELLEKLHVINDRALEEVPELTSDQLTEPTEMPYTAYPIKLGALLFCPIHEAIHAGQIGILRRAHGLEPLR